MSSLARLAETNTQLSAQGFGDLEVTEGIFVKTISVNAGPHTGVGTQSHTVSGDFTEASISFHADTVNIGPDTQPGVGITKDRL